MARLLPCYVYISKNFNTEPSLEYQFTRLDNLTWNPRSHHGLKKIYEQNKRAAGNKGRIAHCNGTTAAATTASSSSITTSQQVFLERRSGEDEEQQLDYLVTQYGWKVRRLDEEDEQEVREVVQIQAEAFHTPVALFDDLFFEFFKAEVLSGLVYKLRNSPPDRYACLVAEPAADSSKYRGQLVGVVDVTAMRDEAVLQQLRGADEYLYISGIAVSRSLRRRKIASALLKACDVLCALWGFEYLALRAYEDDVGARRLYAKAGYRVVSSDPLCMTWIGRKRRVLMVKRLSLLS